MTIVLAIIGTAHTAWVAGVGAATIAAAQREAAEGPGGPKEGPGLKVK